MQTTDPNMEWQYLLSSANIDFTGPLIRQLNCQHLDPNLETSPNLSGSKPWNQSKFKTSLKHGNDLWNTGLPLWKADTIVWTLLLYWLNELETQI